MTPESTTRKPVARCSPVVTSGHRPFTKLDHHGRATTEEFEREGLGIAAKE